MLPPVYVPPGTCRRPSQRLRRTAQKVQAGHPSERLCPSLSCRTESTISASPLPPALPWTAQWHGWSPWWCGELNQRFSSDLRHHSNWFARPHLALSAGLLNMPVAQPWCEGMHQPDLLPCTPCPPALMIPAAAWWARPQPSETMPHRVTDSSRASVQLGASLCNHTCLAPPHYHNNRMRG